MCITMKEDIRPEEAKRLERARISAGFATALAATNRHGWTYSTYKQHEQGLRGFSKSAGKYARAFRVSEGWLLTGEGAPPALPPLPVLGIVAGSVTGHNVIHDEPLEFVRRPEAVATVADAYACRVRGTSMFPAFREDELVIVHPHRQPREGDYVVIQQRGNNGAPVAFIKELVRRHNGDVVARQYTPGAEITFPGRTVIAVHKVLTYRDLFG